ncbi:MAG: magnesium transporter, partial [Candidatus Thorarchaeota archaeon]|nr:magnesium transporter [Candidatus Thorarchaeota archaeon]
MELKLSNLQRTGRLYGGSLFSLAFNIGGLVAGILLATSTSVISSVRWGLLLYPSILSVRGAIGGVFSGRLSTGLHLGTMKPHLTDNTKEFSILVISVAFLSVLSGTILWAYSCGFGILVIGLKPTEIISMFIVMLATMGSSLLVISPITFLVSFVSLRRGLDPDVVTYPIISTTADILVTVIYLSFIVLSKSTVSMMLILAFVAIFIVVTGKIAWTRREQKTLRRTVKEFLSVLFFVGFLVNITGSSLERISRVVTNAPHIYAVFPAIISTVGDVGSIIGSTATTKLGLGTMGASLASFRKQAPEIGSAWAASITWFFGYSIIASWLFG